MSAHSGCRDTIAAAERAINRQDVDVTAVDLGDSVRSIHCPHKVRYWLDPIGDDDE